MFLLFYKVCKSKAAKVPRGHSRRSLDEMHLPCAALLLSQISSLTSVSSTTSFQNCTTAAVSMDSNASDTDLLHKGYWHQKDVTEAQMNI